MTSAPLPWLTGPLTDVHDGHHLHLHPDDSVTCSCGGQRLVGLLSLSSALPVLRPVECGVCGLAGVAGLAVPEVGAGRPCPSGGGGGGRS